MCMPIASRSAEEYPGSTRGARLCAPTVSTHVSVGGLHHAAPHHRAPRHLRHLPPLGADRIPRAATSENPPHWDVMRRLTGLDPHGGRRAGSVVALRPRFAFPLHLLSSSRLCPSHSHSTGTRAHGAAPHWSCTGVRMGAPLAFSSTTTNLAGSVVLALRPTTCTSVGPS
jgi:hypothetical protein